MSLLVRMAIPLNAKQLTIDSYNTHAAELAERYDKLDRRGAIEWTLEPLTKKHPFVFEIGCGSGRDAKEFLKHTSHYIGVDLSEALLAFAKRNVPEATFLHADIETMELPEQIDLVYSSASLLHTNKQRFQSILERLRSKLTPGGLVYLSLKESDQYREEMQIDRFGSRVFYHYSLQDIQEMSSGFQILKERHLKHERDIIWLEVLLQKV